MKKNITGILLAVVGGIVGVLAVISCGGLVVYSVATKAQRNVEARAKAEIEANQPPQLDLNDPKSVVTYWANPVLKIDNDLKHGTQEEQIQKHRAKVIGANVRWKFQVQKVAVNSMIAFQPIETPMTAGEWQNNRLDHRNCYAIVPIAADGNHFVIKDKDFAKTLSVGDTLIVTGKIVDMRGTSRFDDIPIGKNKWKHCSIYNAVLDDMKVSKN